ncbi:MAG: hypothetical protein ABSB69_14065 [Solirubrobacteraceae bacterium]
MVPCKPLFAGLAAAAALAPAPALATPSALAASSALAATAPAKAGTPSASERALLHSHELWATIDVCGPADQPNTVGIRGSMPGDGKAHDKMYMSFRLQYLSAAKQWVNLASGASSGFVAVGSGASARQGGTSFELMKPAAGKAAVTLRGVVDFEWRRGRTVTVSAVEPTAAGHKSLAGADPANYSAATCIIG